jgi:hypothetical protein
MLESFQSATQGSTKSGGISHILIPVESKNKVTKYTCIQDKETLDTVLLQRKIDHFSQASKTPFATEPLNQILGEHGCTQTVLDTLEHIVPIYIPKYPKLFLSTMAQICQTPPLDMSFVNMCNGFKLWQRCTTTSPSGKHLGLFKSLVKSIQYNIQTEKETNNNIVYNNSKTGLPTSQIGLQIQFFLMSLSVKHCHTFERWKVVHFSPSYKTNLPFLNKLQKRKRELYHHLLKVTCQVTNILQKKQKYHLLLIMQFHHQTKIWSQYKQQL